MSEGNPTLHSERRANSARRSSRCMFQRPPLGSFTRVEDLNTKTPRTGILGPGLTGGLVPSTPEPAPSHRPLYLPQERDSPGNRLHSTERSKTPSRSVTFLRGTTTPISVTFLNGLTGSRKRAAVYDGVVSASGEGALVEGLVVPEGVVLLE
jgi:hypothetical protein